MVYIVPGLILLCLFFFLQKLAHKSTSAVNVDNVSVMAESFLANSDEYVQWFAGHCHDSELSKTLFFLIMLHALMKTHKGKNAI